VILGRFRVEKILGQGGMGEVLLARDTLLSRRVALKRLRPEGPQGAARRRDLLKEARRISRITDRRIAAIYDVLELDDDIWIVMEYVDGTTLRERLARPIPIEEFWDLSTQCVEAVAAAHAHGVIHRDIKPENLMLTGEGQIKILDFGIALRAEASEDAAATRTTTTTEEMEKHVIAGTPQYMAPEAHYGGKIDERTDVFSLGAVFYEMLTGRHPFDGATYMDVLKQIMNTIPPPVSEFNPAAGPALSSVIARMLAKDPAERHASCRDLMQDLAVARSGGSIAIPRAERVPLSEHERRRMSAWAAVAVALVVVAGVVLGPSQWRRWIAPPLPANLNLAVLAPITPGASEDFANYALGAVELLHARLQKHQDQPGFQLASFQEGLDENVHAATDARQILGANLALVPTLEQKTDVFRARLELWDTASGRSLGARTIEAPASRPFDLMERLYRETIMLLKLSARNRDPVAVNGVRGAGTLRFLLQGIGRMRSATDGAQAQRAVADLELACRAEPEAAIPRVWLGNAQLKTFLLMGDASWLERAEASDRQAIALDSTRAEGHRALGLVLAAKKDAAGSLVELTSATRLNPTDDDTWLRLARAYDRLGQPAQERATYATVIARRPHCWPPYWWLATWEFREGHVEESIQAYDDMIHRAPDFYKGYSSLGAMLVLRGDYAHAVDTLKHSLALRPTRVAYDNLGTAYFNSGRLEEAVGAYNQSFQFGTPDYRSWLNLGDAYWWLRNRHDQAAEAYAQAVQLGREQTVARAKRGSSFDAMIPANLATVFPKLGQPDSARAYLSRALAADSMNSQVQVCAALASWQLSDKSRALVWLQKAVQGGYPIAWLRDSPVFQEWREEGAFRTLVASAVPEPGTPAPSTGGGRR
jgi:eukaryotic-like serine/threonine-protein kinase